MLWNLIANNQIFANGKGAECMSRSGCSGISCKNSGFALWQNSNFAVIDHAAFSFLHSSYRSWSWNSVILSRYYFIQSKINCWHLANHFGEISALIYLLEREDGLNYGTILHARILGVVCIVTVGIGPWGPLGPASTNSLNLLYYPKAYKL